MELKGCSSIFLDTAPIIYLIEEHPRYCDTVSQIITQASKHNVALVTSIITLIEVLTLPYKENKIELAEEYKNYFNNSNNFSVIDINQEIGNKAAIIRAKHGFKLPDSIQLAVFEYSGCDYFITNDKEIKKYDTDRIYLLE